MWPQGTKYLTFKTKMKALFFLIGSTLLLFTTANAQLPFKYDSLYKTIYAKDLCGLLQKDPGIVLIDVRSAGEYSDTSQYTSLNLGHLKGAINIQIEGMKKNLDTLARFKNKTIVVYCSHSQRSRRVSKLLSENGFANFYNLNGGMSVLTQLSATEFPCKNEWIVSGLPFKNLSYDETADLLKRQPQLLVVDVRPAPQFNGVDSNAANNTGKIKRSINIPYSEWEQKKQSLLQYKSQAVLVYSGSGDGDAARAAASLVQNGFTRVYQQLGGINELIASQDDISFIENKPAYTLLDPHRAILLLQKKQPMLVYDTRPDDEYNNRLTGMISYKNLGRMKNAVHLPANGFGSLAAPVNPEMPVLIYGHEESFKLARLLTEMGYRHVFLLSSFYDFVWSGFNIQDCKAAKDFVEGHEGLY
jgi:rhodanese-related sulfurtransferase